MRLSGKTILLLSPQPWSDFYVSKHHYAIELAKKGNEVFFIGPPQNDIEGIKILKTEFVNLSLIEHRLFFSRNIRFHFRFLFDLLVTFHIKRLLKLINKSVDLVWCFEPNLYSNLKLFKAKVNIFHPVDLLTSDNQINVGKSANLILSVSNPILDLFKEIKTPRFFINHGVSSYYLDSKLNELNNPTLRVAYIGNLLINGLDKKSVREVIVGNSKIQFDFYGSYKSKEENNIEQQKFIQFLSDQVNVNLVGVVNPKELGIKLIEYDIFMLCYDNRKELNGGVNSHKILEYLSTGKLVVSSKLSSYEEYRDLILMSEKDDNSDYVDLFRQGVLEIDEFNSHKKIQDRKAFAKNNSYASQISKIEELLNKVLSS